MYNNGCCTPPLPKKDECCCKDGIICALDWFFQDFLSQPSIIKPATLKYYPKLQDVYSQEISNIIYGIPYISPDMVPVYISEPTGSSTDPYCGDITYLNICEIEGFEFELELPVGVSRTSIESNITSRFTKVKYCSPNNCCCKNGLIEYLLKARDFLTNPCPCGTGASTDVSVTISTCKKSYNVTDILAINQDTVWAKEDIPSTGTPTQTIYYVISLCKIVGLTFNRTNPASLATTPAPTTLAENEVPIMSSDILDKVEEVPSEITE